MLLGIGGVLAATAGMVTLLCSDPAGDPSSAVTTTIADPGGDVVGGDTAGGETVGGDTVLTPSPTSPTTPPPPQWQGILQIDTTGLTLATIPRPPTTPAPPTSAPTPGPPRPSPPTGAPPAGPPPQPRPPPPARPCSNPRTRNR
ncbi:hypothetical protein ACFQ9X_03330 [Catenulispora yoronensis]